MRITTVAIAAIFCLLSACSSPPSTRQVPSLPPDEKLAMAISYIRKDDVPAAMKLLGEITSAAPVPGVTDEALFRLALLQVGADIDKAKLVKTKQTLKRLADDFPESPWTGQGRQLDKFLTKVIKLADEGNDLKRDLKKLKTLDLEIDRRGMK